MIAFRDLAGERIGQLTVLRFLGRTKAGQSKWLCRCDCGTEAVKQGGNLTGSRPTLSCGCLIRLAHVKHGVTTHGHNPRVYRIWNNMRRRCEQSAARGYENYGGRGISVCAAWRDFAAFYRDMGEPPTDTHTLDRINNDGNYEPGNCRWATRTEQAANRRPKRRTQ